MMSMGDWTMQHHDAHNNRNTPNPRGPFGILREKGSKGYTNGFKDVTDGLSNTAAFSERVVGRNNADFKGGFSNSSGLFNSTTLGNAMLPIVPLECKTVAVLNNQYASPGNGLTGVRWADGSSPDSGFNTILAPNSPSCVATGVPAAEGRPILPPTSYHPGGALVSKLDGSVGFIPDTIDTGNLSLGLVTGGRSNYGVWGAIGSMNGGEVISE